MQTAARAASSTASAVSRSPNGSLPFVRENWASPTTVSLGDHRDGEGGLHHRAQLRPSSLSRPGTIWAWAVRRASAQGELKG